MNSTTAFPFQSVPKPDLTLRRRSHPLENVPMEPDTTVPKERRINGPYGQASLQEAWDKLYRARAILEREQTHLRDDRIAIQGEIEALKLREQAVAQREWQIQEYERQFALRREEQAFAEETESTFSKLTKAPFDMARSVFGHKK